ncbi:MAG: hypothetical protein COW73_08275 [Nitrospirae bacterium CG18_big_fil_WC_8_21_14_2_50_70_55]|nr:hypothetical protein [Deltaproteobacteria bacterium]OIP65061.1 MAG: hypothetical protein AUK30_05480 [Nitrospirae bacterium CG2_30_70_394]PIQ04348.1 MAG: hypothetical protein COW73_08275 [Nitrospirae bacterium CG18_big_fil_WC_8_21_14_2_50_70_55]PIU79055.1 MAG: hypothetical protein COS73_05215 [Nitrospirae bacterium CG06_land_8_20_14_3_00_70_43]PIW82452.1 MAG: hypothetical protein COZ96_08725 [Nitrospirae bacterium CG_4_8_14_3_um_filter_70_85]PIX83558.1 MAG: hypothetical protein COZ33_04875 
MSVRVLAVGGGCFEGVEQVTPAELARLAAEELRAFSHLLVTGGDGAVRRACGTMVRAGVVLPVILHPTGTSNILHTLLRLGSAAPILARLRAGAGVAEIAQPLHTIGGEPFLFSAGDLLDRGYMVVAERLRIGPLTASRWRYALPAPLLVPALAALPLYLLPGHFLYYRVGPINVQIGCGKTVRCRHLQLDGDLVELPVARAPIEAAGTVRILCLHKEPPRGR